MGGFYGSVQVRGSDAETVRAAAEAVASKMKIKCLVGPTIGGWIGIYPETSGQDEKVGERIARQIGGDVLHVLVHDDDIFAYWLWRSGKLVDSFYSRPGYFGEKSRAKEEKMRGNAAAFDWLSTEQREELAKLLDREEKVVFEVDRLQEFGRVLEISNLISSYEYLKEGETEEIQGWEEFVEVPAGLLAKERQETQRRVEELQARSHALKSHGLLLAEEVRDEMWARVCRAGDGIAALWYGMRSQPDPMKVFAAPWERSVVLGIDFAGEVRAIASDESGLRVALSIGKKAVIFETASWKPVAEFPFEWPYELSMSGDGRILALGPPERRRGTSMMLSRSTTAGG